MQTRGLTPALMVPRKKHGGMSPAQCVQQMKASAKAEVPMRVNTHKIKRGR